MHNHFARWFSRNQKAVDAFLKRKTAGMNLSQRVWQYVDNLKVEMETALSISLGQGDSAATVSRKVRKYLNNPDDMFRRFRYKKGEDEDGNAVYGRKWKRKYIDKTTGKVTWKDFNPGDYHTGKGVYRSAYKNAMRMTRTEINMAYRTADQDRWRRMDFVVGYRVKRSNNHPSTDICDDLSAANNDDTSDKGVYPKDFVFKGWHPQCRCFVVPILAQKYEFIEMQKAILNGEEPPRESVNAVKDVPRTFKDWLDANNERLQNASSVPYFIRDNPKYTGIQPHYGSVGTATGTKLGRAATKAAFKIYEDMPATTLTAEVAANTEAIAKDLGIKGKPTPMTFLEANEGRGNVSYGKGREYEENCQAVVAVHEARLRGLNVTARGYDNSIGSASYQLGERFESIWENPGAV